MSAVERVHRSMRDDFEDKAVFAVIVVAIFMIVMVIISGFNDIITYIKTTITDRPAFKSGESAAKLGLPANSNPYTGASSNTKQAEWWLEGYISAKRGELTAESK